MKNLKFKIKKYFNKHKTQLKVLNVIKHICNTIVYLFALFCAICLIIAPSIQNNDSNNKESKQVQYLLPSSDSTFYYCKFTDLYGALSNGNNVKSYLQNYSGSINISNIYFYNITSSMYKTMTYVNSNYSTYPNNIKTFGGENYYQFAYITFRTSSSSTYYSCHFAINVNANNLDDFVCTFQIGQYSVSAVDYNKNQNQDYAFIKITKQTGFNNALISLIDDYVSNNGVSISYNNINIINSYLPSSGNINKFEYQVNDTYTTFSEWYLSGESPLQLIDNSYFNFNGLGAIKKLVNGDYVNLLPSDNITDNMNLYFYGSSITSEDLEDSYNNGYQTALNNEYKDVNLTISNNLDFNLIYSSLYQKYYLPNVGFNMSLPNYYQSSYDLNGLTFRIANNNQVYDTIRVNYGLISDFNFNFNESNRIDLAFVNGDFELDYQYSDNSNYIGATNYTTLLGLDQNLNKYYYVKSIDFVNTTGENEILLNVFNGVRTKELTYYTQSSSTGGGSLVATQNTTTGTYFVRDGWLNENYRRIIIESNSQQLLDVPNSDLNSITLFDFLNGGYVNSGLSTTAEVNNAFSLLGGAFNSIGGFLSIQILPNITLGVLMFIPLVVMIIFVVIRIIKKG